MPRRAVRTKTAPLPCPEVAQRREDADAGRTILSVRDRSLLLMNAAQTDASGPKRRGSRGEGGERRSSIGERRGSVSGRRPSVSERKDSISEEGDAQRSDELAGMSIAEKMRLFSNQQQAPQRISRRRTQPVRLEDLVRAEQMLQQQENIPEPEKCPDVGSFVKQWERRTSVSEAPRNGRDSKDVDNGEAEPPQSPVVRRRASRSILRRMQSFGGNSKDGETEEAENRPPLVSSESADVPQSRGNWTKNDAVARRRTRKLDRFSAVFSSELASDVSSIETVQTVGDNKPTEEEKPKPRPLKAYGSARRSTQPITKMELDATEETAVCRGQSIQERLANMRNASESWKNRVSKGDSPEKVVTEALNRGSARSSLSPPSVSHSTPKLRDNPKQRAVSTLLENRKSQLEVSQQGWRERVEEKDTSQFTVEGKLRSSGQDPAQSPKVVRRSGAALKRGSPRAISFHGRPSIDDGLVRKLPSMSPKSPAMRRIKLDENEEMSQMQKSASVDEKEPPVIQATVESERRVEVPNLVDEQVIEFLSPSRPIEDIMSSDTPVLDPESMEVSTSDSLILKCVVKTTRPPRRRRGQGNPVRRKNERTDLFKSEYTETVTDTVDKEQRKAELEAKATEIKTAALASRENIAEAMGVLKRADGNRTPARDCLPYKSLMLIHVKGQRQVQVRLVEPSPSSMNSGDCFVLVTPDRVFAWLGTYSNRMEQRRAVDLAHLIVQRKDLGVRSANEAMEVQEERRSGEEARLFWHALGLTEAPTVPGIGDLEEDAHFEQAIQVTNAVYEMREGELRPLEDWWGRQLRRAALQADRAFVLDFGSELYVWLGRELGPADRRRAVALGRKLFQQGYDYRGCGINPLCPLREEEEDDDSMYAAERPKWALFGRISQNMETLLFTAKFSDWPSSDRMVGVKPAEKTGKANPEIDFDSSRVSPADVDRMISEKLLPARLVLEGTNLARGGSWTAVEDGLRRSYTIDTRSVSMWLASEYSKSLVEPSSHGQFHRQCTYVVRWQYRVYVGGRRQDDSARSSGIGRERFVYFYWQGRDSSLTDKGASALLTVELDTEKGPQQCVLEGQEPPAFCRLFPLMAVHPGRPQDPTEPLSLYIVQGDRVEEGHLSAVPLQAQALRSRASFLLINRAVDGASWLWHGRLSPKHSREVGKDICRRLQEAAPPEFRLSEDRLGQVEEVEEGEEEEQMWSLLGSRREAAPQSPSEFKEGSVTLRLWRFSAVSGRLRAGEVAAPLHAHDLATALPFLQSDLYSAPQPALFLVDGGAAASCFLWHGWFNQAQLRRSQTEEEAEEDEGEGGSVDGARTTGSLRSQFTRVRLAALETAAKYGELRYGERAACRVVYAGLEPPEFLELFPWWTEKPEAAASQRREGRTAEDKMESADTLLQRFLTQRFTVERLTSRPLPEGVDPLFLEMFLEDGEFERAFHMSREDFLAMPHWKKMDVKKEAGLF